MHDMQVWFLGQEDPLEEGNSNPVQYSCLGKPIDQKPAGLLSMGVTKESDMTVTKQQKQQSMTQCFLISGSVLILTVRSCVYSAAEERVSRTESWSSSWDYKAWGGNHDRCRDSCRETFHPTHRFLSSPNRMMATLVSSAQSPLRNSYQVDRDDQLSKVLALTHKGLLWSLRLRWRANPSWKGVCYHLWSNWFSE